MPVVGRHWKVLKTGFNELFFVNIGDNVKSIIVASIFDGF